MKRERKRKRDTVKQQNIISESAHIKNTDLKTHAALFST